MTDHEMFYAQLQNQEKILNKWDSRLSGIEKALTELALQGKDISYLTGQLNTLWRKYDELLAPGGALDQMKNHQSACPGDDLKRSINQVWGAIGLIGLLIGALKIWG